MQKEWEFPLYFDVAGVEKGPISDVRTMIPLHVILQAMLWLAPRSDYAAVKVAARRISEVEGIVNVEASMAITVWYYRGQGFAAWANIGPGASRWPQDVEVCREAGCSSVVRLGIRVVLGRFVDALDCVDSPSYHSSPTVMHFMRTRQCGPPTAIDLAWSRTYAATYDLLSMLIN